MNGVGKAHTTGAASTSTAVESTESPGKNKEITYDGSTAVPTANASLAGAPQLSLEAPQPMNLEDMMLALIALRNAFSEKQAESSKEVIRADLSRKTEENKEQIKKMEEAIEKMEDAKKSGVFGQVFGWIGAVAAVVVAAALIATGIGAAAGALLIAGATLAMANMIFTQAGGMEAIGPEAAKIVGWVVLAAEVALAIASLGVGASKLIGKGVEKLASKLGPGMVKTLMKDTATKLAKDAAPMLATAGKKGTDAHKFATVAKYVAISIQGTGMVGQGSASITSAVLTRDATEAQASAKGMEAAMLKFQAMMEEEIRRLKKLMDEMQEGVSIAMQVLSNATETKSAILQKTSV